MCVTFQQVIRFAVFKPATHPKLKYRNQMFGAQILMMKPNEAINVPAIAVVRHPNLLIRALAIGPTHIYTVKILLTDYHQISLTHADYARR